VSKAHVSVKSVQTANSKLVSRSHGVISERVKPAGFHVRPNVPSRTEIADAGKRALNSFKK
jgi:hypothetical protein